MTECIKHAYTGTCINIYSKLRLYSGKKMKTNKDKKLEQLKSSFGQCIKSQLTQRQGNGFHVDPTLYIII